MPAIPAPDLAEARAPPSFAYAGTIFVGVVLCALVLPSAYATLVASSGGRLVPPLYPHILANCLANLIVVVVSAALTGRLDQKLTKSANVVLAAHGLLALTIVLTHSFYSNRVMIAAACVSAVLGFGAAFIRHRAQPTRVAAIGPWDSLAEQIPPYAERLSDPAADLCAYDVVLIGSGELPAEWTRSLTRAMRAGRRVRHSAEYLEEARGLVSLDHFDVDQLGEGGLTSYRTGKRTLDLLLVLAAAPVAALVLAAAALAILATMGRPVFFVQARTGLGGRPFNLVKLRTMRPEAPGAGRATGVRDDRVTPLGRWLRKTRIDELPQLWNVLLGEMSVIGPRPEWTVLAEGYATQIPAYAYRHVVRPGITGWAQVRSGYAGDVRETRLKLAYDLFYVKNYSFALDLQIIVRTAGILLTAWGAR